jgi:plasmid stabilization system protein ParE
MPRLIWSPRALDDIARLHAFLKPKAPDAARRAIQGIRQSVRLLGTHPEAGKPIEEMPPEFREWMIEFGNSGYVALYRYDGTEVIVLAVRHQKEAGY